MKVPGVCAFFLVFSLAFFVATPRSKGQGMGYQHPAFTLRSQIHKSGELAGEQTLYFFSNGDFREVKRDGDHLYGTMRIRGKGFYVIDDSRQSIREEKRVNIAAYMPIQSEQELRGSPGYINNDTLLGIDCMVVRETDPQTNKPLSEIWYAPRAVGFAALKEILYDRETGEELLRLEPVSLQFGEPDRSLLNLPNYPMRSP